jgi:hypothetical protein
MSSIGGLDPLADAYNLMGAQGLTNPNPYLEFTGQIPMAGYQGAPTDAAGNPIQSFLQAQAQHDAWNAANPAPAATPGTTLNSAPPQQQLQRVYLGQGTGGAAGGENAMGSGGPTGGQLVYGYAMVPQQGIHPQQAAAPAAPQNPIDMRQAYLTALANPGKPAQPGAVMQPGATPTGGVQPSVLAAFLAAHPQGGTSVPGKGGGGYSNTGFFDTLNQLQAQKGAAA